MIIFYLFLAFVQEVKMTIYSFVFAVGRIGVKLVTDGKLFNFFFFIKERFYKEPNLSSYVLISERSKMLFFCLVWLLCLLVY